MIERGEQIGDERSGGEILAGIVGGEEGFDAYGVTKGYRGIMLPSSRYTEGKNADIKSWINTKNFPDRDPYTPQVLQKQGIQSLLPPEEGSTVYYDTGEDDAPRGADLSTLLEELAHLGMRKLQTDKGEITNITKDYEEFLMDLMQGRAEAESGVYSAPGNKDRYISMSSRLKEVDRAALEELGMRGVPIQVKQKTTAEKLMGLSK